jgi:hypothetical protein
MTQLPRRDIKSSLLKKGFKEENRDHWVFRLYVNNKKTSISTKVSFGSNYREIGEDLIQKMKKELCMPNKKYFIDFVECFVTGDKYTADLISGNKIKI